MYKILLLAIVLNFVGCEDHYKNGIKSYQDAFYIDAKSEFKMVPKDDANYNKSIIYLGKIDSIYVKRKEEIDNIKKSRITTRDSIIYYKAISNINRNKFYKALDNLDKISSRSKYTLKKVTLTDELNNKRRIFEKKKNKLERKRLRNIIRIKSYRTYGPNSAGSVSFNIIWQNRTNKTVKYAYFTVYPYNAVGDLVSCEIRGNTGFTGKVTGPIKPKKWSGYNSSWSDAWYNNSIRKIDISKITIEYTDGSSERIIGSSVDHIIY